MKTRQIKCQRIDQGCRHSGFALVELVVVFTVVSALALITFLAYPQITERMRQTERRADIHQIQQALERYYAANGHYPYGSTAVGQSGINTTAMTSLKQETIAPPRGNCNVVCTGVEPAKVISEVHRMKASEVPPSVIISYTSGSYFCTTIDSNLCPAGGESYVYVPLENDSSGFGCENPPSSCQAYELSFRDELAGTYDGATVRNSH